MHIKVKDFRKIVETQFSFTADFIGFDIIKGSWVVFCYEIRKGHKATSMKDIIIKIKERIKDK